MSSSVYDWFHPDHSHRPHCEIIITTIKNAEIHTGPLATLKGSVAYGK